MYLDHKIHMEQMVRDHFDNYNIIRIGNIDFGNNPKTFLNWIRHQQKTGAPYRVRDEYKYMITKKELLLITDHLPLAGQNEINVFGKMALVKDLI